MSNVKEMPMPNNEPQGEAEERKARAKEHFSKIKTAATVQSRNSLLIGYHAYRLKEENLFGILGYANEHEARSAAGVSKSTWFSTISLAEAFKDLPVDLFIRMKLSNAIALADMPESKRLDRDWVEKAACESIEYFERLVDEEMQGKARTSDTKERSTTMKITMPVSQKAVIDEKVGEFAEAHDMDPEDTGKVIEAMAVEATGGDTMLNVILHVVHRAKKIKELCESGLSADEVLAEVVKFNEENILECAAILGTKGEQEEAA